jgi:hypothetical protein
VEDTVTTPRISSTSETARPERRSEPTHLSQRYGTIGIQAVAAAARYASQRDNRGRPSTPAAWRIDLRFVESAR